MFGAGSRLFGDGGTQCLGDLCKLFVPPCPVRFHADLWNLTIAPSLPQLPFEPPVSNGWMTTGNHFDEHFGTQVAYSLMNCGGVTAASCLIEHFRRRTGARWEGNNVHTCKHRPLSRADFLDGTPLTPQPYFVARTLRILIKTVAESKSPPAAMCE